MFPRSINTIITNCLKITIRNMSNESRNPLKYMNFLNNKFIIFMSLVPESDKIIVINIYYTILCKARSTTVSLKEFFENVYEAYQRG